VTRQTSLADADTPIDLLRNEQRVLSSASRARGHSFVRCHPVIDRCRTFPPDASRPLTSNSPARQGAARREVERRRGARLTLSRFVVKIAPSINAIAIVSLFDAYVSGARG
jgi:hypothetical protein